MRLCRFLSKSLLLVLFVSSVSQGQVLSPEDVQEFDVASGVGCIGKKPITDKAEYYFVCKSRKSGEQAWNAALYRSKVACGKDKFSVFFNVPPSLPTISGIYESQVEVNCSSERKKTKVGGDSNLGNTSDLEK